MLVSLHFHKDNKAFLYQIIQGTEQYWDEMIFTQWFLIRMLSNFYSMHHSISDTLTGLYINEEFLNNYIQGNPYNINDAKYYITEFVKYKRECGYYGYTSMSKIEFEVEIMERQYSAKNMIMAINTELLQKPVFLHQEINMESNKNITTKYPDCIVEMNGFGGFFGISDLNQKVFWSPFVLLRYIYLRYHLNDTNIIKILNAIPKKAAAFHAKEEIKLTNHRDLSIESINSIKKDIL